MMIIVSLLPFLIELKTVWLSFFFGVALFLFIYKTKNGHDKVKNNNRIQQLIAGIIIFFPFIVSLLTFIEYGSIYTNFIPGILVMDTALIFFQYFLVIPFSFISAPSSQKNNPENPLVSILVPAFNEEKWIKKTLESIIEVEYPNKEIIVIDDGSTDNTFLISSNLAKKSKNIKVFKKKNGGKASAINYGLLIASGEIIVITDADGLVSRNSLREIVNLFQNPSVVGVAGNIRVINKSNILTNCQALEYSLGINLYRAATASFGIVEVLPGPLSSFRRSAIEMVGRFDSDTIVEDADFTKKLLKTGSILQATANSYAYTEAPSNLQDFVKQRTRWYRGNIQTFLKHRDLRDFSSNIFNASILMPLSFLQIFVQPWLGVFSLISLIYSIYSGSYVFVERIFFIFIVMQFLISFIAISKGGEDYKLLIYSPFLIFGYKHIIDIIKIKCLIQHFTKGSAKWDKVERKGPDF